MEHVILSSLSEVFRLRKTATKPAEFSSLNTTNSLYFIVSYLILVRFEFLLQLLDSLQTYDSACIFKTCRAKVLRAHSRSELMAD